MIRLISISLFVLTTMHVASAGAISPASAKTDRPKDIYLAIRTDGLTGSGTKYDPYDGSTATKLDNVLRTISNGSTVHFGPGTFQSAGFQNNSESSGFYVKPMCHYLGAGRNRTTIKVVAATNNGHFACAFCSPGTNADVSGSSVESMTIDMNGAALVAANGVDLKTYGVSLPGRNNTIRNVHLIHMYGHEATGAEAFGLGVCRSASNAMPSGNLIEDCLVDTFATGNDYGQMICIGGGIAHDNWVIGQVTNTSAYQAYGANAILDRCYARNCRTFLYMDEGDVGPLTVKNCRAWGITNAFINLAPSAGFTHHDVRVMNNKVEFGPTGTFFNAFAGGTGARLYNIRIVNNSAAQMFGIYSPFNISQVHNFHSSGNSWIKTGASREKRLRERPATARAHL